MTCLMHPECKKCSEPLRAEIERLKAQVATLAEALRPYADIDDDARAVLKAAGLGDQDAAGG